MQGFWEMPLANWLSSLPLCWWPQPSEQRAKCFHVSAVALVLGVPKKSGSNIKIPACERTWRRWKHTLSFVVPVVGKMTSIRGTGWAADVSDTINRWPGGAC